MHFCLDWNIRWSGYIVCLDRGTYKCTLWTVVYYFVVFFTFLALNMVALQTRIHKACGAYLQSTQAIIKTVPTVDILQFIQQKRALPCLLFVFIHFVCYTLCFWCALLIIFHSHIILLPGRPLPPPLVCSFFLMHLDTLFFFIFARQQKTAKFSHTHAHTNCMCYHGKQAPLSWFNQCSIESE